MNRARVCRVLNLRSSGKHPDAACALGAFYAAFAMSHNFDTLYIWKSKRVPQKYGPRGSACVAMIAQIWCENLMISKRVLPADEWCGPQKSACAARGAYF